LSLDLDQRNGWPAELRVLLEHHPRDSWRLQGSVSVQFWLEVHDHLRRECVGLEASAQDYLEGRKTAPELAVIARPRLRGMIAHLHGHHQIEDSHYFPAFRAFEPRLARGFDALESDHADLQQDIAAALTALQELATAAGVPLDTHITAHAAQRYAAVGGRLCRRLCRHLSDEEDLVVPVLLEQPSY
jgi:hypothetical protein